MIMPSYTTLPESMLGNSALVQKFAVPAMAGLRGMGCDCSELDDNGNCLDPDPCVTSTPIEVSDCAYGGTYPNCNAAPGGEASIICTAGQVIDASTGVCTAPGNTVAAFCTQQGETYNSATGLCNTPSGTSPSAGLTQAQVNAIISGATKVGTVAAAGATGATILRNGTVIGSGTVTSSTLGASLSKYAPLLLIGIVAVFVLKGAGK